MTSARLIRIFTEPCLVDRLTRSAQRRFAESPEHEAWHTHTFGSEDPVAAFTLAYVPYLLTVIAAGTDDPVHLYTTGG